MSAWSAVRGTIDAGEFGRQVGDLTLSGLEDKGALAHLPDEARPFLTAALEGAGVVALHRIDEVVALAAMVEGDDAGEVGGALADAMLAVDVALMALGAGHVSRAAAVLQSLSDAWRTATTPGAPPP